MGAILPTQYHAAIGVLDTDGLHLPGQPLVPIRGAIRHVGDLYNGARRHGLTQLWLTDTWVRAAACPTRSPWRGSSASCAMRSCRTAWTTCTLSPRRSRPGSICARRVRPARASPSCSRCTTSTRCGAWTPTGRRCWRGSARTPRPWARRTIAARAGRAWTYNRSWASAGPTPSGRSPSGCRRQRGRPTRARDELDAHALAGRAGEDVPPLLR